jgi:hypothetical protein
LTGRAKDRIVCVSPPVQGQEMYKIGSSPMHTRISAALAPLVVCGLASLASAQEYCVTCTGPAAQYRCLIGGHPSVAALTSRGQLLCITELAKIGPHASCSVGRPTSGVCGGEPRTVMFPSAADPEAAPVTQWRPETTKVTVAPATVQALKEPVAPSPAPPQTVEELAKETVTASGKGLKKAGEAVSDTAQSAGNVVTKTWHCLSSFFSDC